MTKRIFVYGTLRRKPYGLAPLMRNANFIEETSIPGFDMYSLGPYPGIKHNEDNKQGIVGEVYEVSDDTLKQLDFYEGYREGDKAGSMYLREEVQVNGQPTFVYVYNGTTDEPWMKPLSSGNWKDAND